MYERPSEMEPMVPSGSHADLTALAHRTARESAALGAMLHPITRQAVVELLRVMNSYYSNLIEGHATHPLDIERALRSDFSEEPATRALQLESKAHVEVQRLIEARQESEPGLDVCAAPFLQWIHHEFYQRMPAEFRELRHQDTVELVVPGALRAREVVVGRHLPPKAATLESFLTWFSEAYSPKRLSGLAAIAAAPSAHHRLAWIHPFLDGNGRVTRLFTDAYLRRVGVDAHGLWTVSRGLARRRDQYLAALAEADEPRRGDLDGSGRGNLSESSLVRFGQFFFEVALDQIQFMVDLLDLEGLERRVLAYVAREASIGKLRPEGAFLVRDVMLRGEVPRGEAPRITGTRERTARGIVAHLLAKGLLRSASHRAGLRWGLPLEALGYYFPRLYPEGVEFMTAFPRAAIE